MYALPPHFVAFLGAGFDLNEHLRRQKAYMYNKLSRRRARSGVVVIGKPRDLAKRFNNNILTKLVQTRFQDLPKKVADGRCQKCGRNDARLERAHSHPRSLLFTNIATRLQGDTPAIPLDLDELEIAFEKEHQEIVLLSLCTGCHATLSRLERNAASTPKFEPATPLQTLAFLCSSKHLAKERL